MTLKSLHHILFTILLLTGYEQRVLFTILLLTGYEQRVLLFRYKLQQQYNISKSNYDKKQNGINLYKLS